MMGNDGLSVKVFGRPIPCPRGSKIGIVPMIQVILASGASLPANFSLSIRWQDRSESSKSSKSNSPKYIALLDTKTNEQWISARISEKDREEFENLRKKWGMWFLDIVHSDPENSVSWMFLNNGNGMSSKFIHDLDGYVGSFDSARIKNNIEESMDFAIKFVTGTTQLSANTNSTLFGKKGEDYSYYQDIKSALVRIPDVLEDIGGGKLPWVPQEMPYWGKPDPNAHDFVVYNYLSMLKSFDSNSKSTLADQQSKQLCMEMLQMLKQAKIFEISPESYIELYNKTYENIVQNVAQLDFSKLKNGSFSLQERLILKQRTIKACKDLEFPDKIPFPVCWFGIAGGITLSDDSIRALELGKENESDVYSLVGIIISQGGDVHEVVGRLDNQSHMLSETFVVTHRFSVKNKYYRDGIDQAMEWNHPESMTPFVIHGLLDAVNNHQSTIIGQRRLGIQNSNKMKKTFSSINSPNLLPPDFYIVHLKNSVIKEVVRDRHCSIVRSKINHRFDVRGHWCMKIYRGPLPMDPVFELHLEKLRYNIYKTSAVDSWIKDSFAERQIPQKSSDEWIAVKKFWRKPHIKGPENAKYVPSTRRATKGILAFDNNEISTQDADELIA